MSLAKNIFGAVREKLALLWAKIPAKHVDVVIAVTVTLMSLAVYAFVVTGNSRAGFTFINNIEERSLDARFRMRGPRSHDERIVIVDIDEKTIQKAGAYPIPRNVFAQGVDKLAAGGASIVSFDVNFPTPEKNSAVTALNQLRDQLGTKAPSTLLETIRQIESTSDNDAQLAKSIGEAQNVILGHMFLGGKAANEIDAKMSEEYYTTLWGHPFPQMLKAQNAKDFDLNRAWAVTAMGPVSENVSANMRILAEAARSHGFFDFDPESDGTVRRSMLVIRYRDREWFPSLALETLRQYESIKDQSIAGYIGPNGLERIELGPHNFATERDGTVLINFVGPYETYQHYSLIDVVDGTINPEEFKDKIVFIGATAKAAGDLRNTPFQKADTGYMGVEIHANVLDNLLHSNERGRGYLSRGLNEEMIDIAYILVFGLGMGYLFARVKPLFATLSVVVALIVFGWIVYLSFAHFGMWLNLVIPAGTLIVNYGSITSHRMIFEEREKRRVRQYFAMYVAPGVIRMIEQDPGKYLKAGGESKELSIMFSDIRSFTTISESLTPDELVGLLNEYLGEMTDILFKRWGTLDKYIGDAVMAFWGSPFPQDDHAIRACAAALDMSARLQELNLKWEAEGRKQLSIGIGINTGRVSVGNMGSGKRVQFTVMGDPVNLASRLEGQNKEYRTERIISEFTYAQVKEHYVCRELDRIRVKGKLKPVGIYELMAFGKDAGKHQDLLMQWSKAQDAYYAQVWDEAVQRFEALLAKYPDDGPTETFLMRSYEFRKEMPSREWDGVYVAKTK